MTNNATLFISASPRMKGTSVMLLEHIRSQLSGNLVHLYREDQAALLEKMHAADCIVISGPCYINCYPGTLMHLLEAASQEAPWQGQKLYGIINGGMPYVHTHKSGIDTLALFAEACGLKWMGGFVLGGGAMLNGRPLENHLSAKKVVPAFDTFVQHIAKGETSPDALYEDAQIPPGMLMTQVLARMLSFMVTRKLKKYGHDPSAKRPYSNGA